ncbi:MAG TPA: hypothetical protein VGB49_09655, partial [Caulobacteraceae bacterium]
MRLLAAAFLLAAAASSARAGAWAPPAGETLVIAKVETMAADEGFDPDGARASLLGERRDDFASLYVEHGLTDRLTVQFKTEAQRGRDPFVEFSGLGQTEIGLRWQAYRSERTAVSLYAAYAVAGEGRNAGYAAPGEGEGDWEARVLAGRSGRLTRFGQALPVFVEVQAARRVRAGLPDETRLETTAGVELNPRWS